MPTINPGLDGHVGARTSAWTTLLTAASGKSIDTAGTGGTGTSESDNTVSILAAAAANGSTYNHRHSFLAFDTSGISSCNGSATLKVFVDSTAGSPIIIAVEGTYDETSPSVDYFNDFDRTVPYSGNISVTSTGEYLSIVLNSAAISAIENENVFKVMLIDRSYVFASDTPPNGDVKATNIRYNEVASGKPELITADAAAPSKRYMTLGKGMISISGQISL